MLELVFIMLVSSAFIKLVTTLSIFQYGLGLKNFSFSFVVFLLSLVLTLFVMQPTWDNLGGWQGVSTANSEKIANFQTQIDPFIVKHSDAETLTKLQAIYQKAQPDAPVVTTPWSVKITAFMITELKEAFYIGLLLIIPFIFLDLLVVNILMALNITQISALTVALPFKLLIFYLFNGWQLLTEKLLSFYY